MLKIIHVDTGEDLRGGQHQLLTLARGLAARGHQQLIVTLDGTLLETRAHQEGFRVFALPRHDPAGAHGIFQLRQLLLADPFEILHAHDGKGQTISWLASIGLKVSRVASRRVIYAPPRRVDTRLKYGRTCDAVIAVSKYVGGLLVDAGVPETKIEVIYDGVELSQRSDNAAVKARVRAHLNRDCETKNFVVGHITGEGREKGQDVVLDAATLLKASMPEVRIVMASPVIQGKAPGAAGPDHLRIEPSPNLGWIVLPTHSADFFAALDLFIMPSRAEGLGSAALVAMAQGVPVVASRVGGLPEIVEEGKTGWLVPPGSPQALADAIAQAASDPVRLCEMGNHARLRASQFSSTLMVERTEALYKKLAGEKSSMSTIES